ncbi:S-adenosyl-L-methionine-dependent methyltransferase [Mycena leptocephala]|nr:S-adenosyl-L-methionine-dependent methyltransferase [Mycena leptocephala]
MSCMTHGSVFLLVPGSFYILKDLAGYTMANMDAAAPYAVLAPPSLSFIRQYLSTILWTWLVNFARKQILSALERGIVKGHLEISENERGNQSIGNKNGSDRSAVLVIVDPNFWVRILFSYDIGFSEAYMAGDFQTPDLQAVLNLYVDNLENLGHLASPFYKLLRLRDVFAMLFLRHGLSKSVENVAGYNASNEMYRAFLSKEMMYSCPMWGDGEGGVRGDLEGSRRPGDLEAAQTRKIAHILKKAGLGRGIVYWRLELDGAAKLGCTVDTITISSEQQQGAQQNVEAAGLQAQVRIHLMDYRNMPASFEKAFDACISIEMLEAVGVKNMKIYLQKINWALKDDHAAVVLTSTTYPENTYTKFQGNDFTRKYHWPNGVSPSPSSLLMDFETHLPRRFCVESVEDMGQHYPRCLREWGRQFEENWTEKLDITMAERFPELNNPANMAMFRRKWGYMFLYMEVAYSRWWLGLTCWTLKRPGRDPALFTIW